MILYFTGTGNSFYVASKIAEATSDRLISIADMYKAENYIITLNTDEFIGIVFPVYWYGMPKVVEEYLSHLKIENYKSNYTYIVTTYGKGVGNAIFDTTEFLKKKNIAVNGEFSIKMVDNYIFMQDIPTLEKQKRILDRTDIELEQTIQLVQNKKSIGKNKSRLTGFVYYFIHNKYKSTNHTKHFSCTDACVGCGICSKNCPCQTISLESGKPIWTGDCTFCLACIHRCPQKAIQYGKGTSKKRRYVNPIFR